MAKESIFKDPVNPGDFLKFELMFSCEHCSHFDQEEERCTMGYNAANHRLSDQLRSYSVSGRIAFCRFLEID